MPVYHGGVDDRWQHSQRQDITQHLRPFATHTYTKTSAAGLGVTTGAARAREPHHIPSPGSKVRLCMCWTHVHARTANAPLALRSRHTTSVTRHAHCSHSVPTHYVQMPKLLRLVMPKNKKLKKKIPSRSCKPSNVCATDPPPTSSATHTNTGAGQAKRTKGR